MTTPTINDIFSGTPIPPEQPGVISSGRLRYSRNANRKNVAHLYKMTGNTMATTRDDIRAWLKRAPEGATHMLVVCDTFDCGLR
jgi:hypothetical protein